MARLTGKDGIVYLWNGSSYDAIDAITDWVFDTSNEVLNASIKMDFQSRWVPSHNEAHFTAKRRNSGIQVWPAAVIDAANNGTRTQWRLDLVGGNGSFTQIVVTGYAKTASTSAPSDAAEESFELQVDETWTYSG